MAFQMSHDGAPHEVELLITRPEPRVCVLTLNRPAARNALSLDLIEALLAALGDLAADKTCGAIVLAANGRVFCAGHDLKELTSHRGDADGGRAFYTLTMTRCTDLMQAIVASPKPVIAAVSGMATAAGCQLVASCDLAVASNAASFATPGVNIGLFCSTPMVALSRNVPRKRAMEMLLTGEAMNAAEAVDHGLVNRVVADGEVAQSAMALARTIASKPPATIALGKAAFHRQIDMPLSDAYADAVRVMVANMLDDDAKEGIGAFLEKRAPVWRE